MFFDHEKLDAYQATLDFVAAADEVVAALPRGRGYLVDQLRRAATSIALNIAEGSGEFSPPEKIRFYRMALRSATECGALLDVCQRVGLSDARTRAAGRELLVRVVSMLTKLIHSVERRERDRERERERLEAPPP